MLFIGVDYGDGMQTNFKLSKNSKNNQLKADSTFGDGSTFRDPT